MLPLKTLPTRSDAVLRSIPRRRAKSIAIACNSIALLTSFVRGTRRESESRSASSLKARFCRASTAASISFVWASVTVVLALIAALSRAIEASSSAAAFAAANIAPPTAMAAPAAMAKPFAAAANGALSVPAVFSRLRAVLLRLRIPLDAESLRMKASVVVRSATLARLSCRHRRFNPHKLQATQHPLARSLFQFPRRDAPPLS